jgi:hypothetical protein
MDLLMEAILPEEGHWGLLSRHADVEALMRRAFSRWLAARARFHLRKGIGLLRQRRGLLRLFFGWSLPR